MLLATATHIKKVNCYLGDTPLIKAVRSNNVNLVKRLLESGVDAKATNSYRQTALMLAAWSGDGELVELLLPKSDVQGVSY